MAAANEKARSVAADTGQGAKAHETCHAESISPKAESVNEADWINDFRVRNRLRGTEIVETIRALFPGFDKSLLSKCMSPEKYGVRLAPEAEDLLKQTYEGEEKDGTA